MSETEFNETPDERAWRYYREDLEQISAFEGIAASAAIYYALNAGVSQSKEIDTSTGLDHSDFLIAPRTKAIIELIYQRDGIAGLTRAAGILNRELRTNIKSITNHASGE